MPALLSNVFSEKVSLQTSEESPYKPPHQGLGESSHSAGFDKRSNFTNGDYLDTANTSDDSPTSRGQDRTMYGINGVPQEPSSASAAGIQSGKPSVDRLNGSLSNGSRPSQESSEDYARSSGSPKFLNQSSTGAATNQKQPSAKGRRSFENGQAGRGWHKGHGRAHSSSAPQNINSTYLSSIQGSPPSTETTIFPNSDATAVSNKPVTSAATSPSYPPPALASSSTSSLHPTAPRLHHRHTLEVPRVSTSRTSRDFSYPNTASDVASENGRFTPTPRTPRASNTIARAQTRSIHSDMMLDEIPPDSDMARWAETVRQKRASRRRKKEEEEDDRVVVGTKVDINHVNWVTAYNMLTGIRFTVSRTNAKIDRPDDPLDFDARHKFSFDITGNELTPSAKYDFKFKDYAPRVFRRLRAKFRIDPADYLVSLTSKYILSELGSPGKSGSFFYFSRDYKYIIKTIHHAEHKLLRAILREYYKHIENNPNTLLSQFYGLHRVKIPYGRKIHFVVMNNLFPPHRDIHQTFDLKGSTIGRDFREEDAEKNPRATLKDLNWLRRDYHFEFGSLKKKTFVEQMQKDVALLQRLKIMDYSLLVGIHDLKKGNEENLRDKTLRVFQPGGDDDAEQQARMLTRTPSKLENVKQAKQLREIIKKERPVPIENSANKMPEEMLDDRTNSVFYSDDGGFRATHEDGQPGEEIYYLGIIDCLTHYGLIKRMEHLWKGMSNNKSQISPIPPDGYGDRFVKFIGGLTKTKEEVERDVLTANQMDGSTTASNRQLSWSVTRQSTDKVVEKAEKQALKSKKEGASEDSIKDRTLSTMRGPSPDRGGPVTGATLPVVQEDTEGGSREASIRDEKSQTRKPSTNERPPPLPANTDPVVEENRLPTIPHLNRLSIGLGSGGASGSQ